MKRSYSFQLLLKRHNISNRKLEDNTDALDITCNHKIDILHGEKRIVNLKYNNPHQKLNDLLILHPKIKSSIISSG